MSASLYRHRAPLLPRSVIDHLAQIHSFFRVAASLGIIFIFNYELITNKASTDHKSDLVSREGAVQNVDDYCYIIAIFYMISIISYCNSMYNLLSLDSCELIEFRKRFLRKSFTFNQSRGNSIPFLDLT